MVTSRQILLEAESEFNRIKTLSASEIDPILAKLAARHGVAPVLEGLAFNHFVALKRIHFLEAENARLRAAASEEGAR